jgi:hypothetical protein
VTDEDHGEEQDPLLVRPYLQPDADASAADRSTQTWPAATTREVRSQRAFEGAGDPTMIIPTVPPETTRRPVPRHLLVVLAACAAVLLGVAAGFAAMRATRPAVTAAQPDAPIPALSGLVPGSPAASPAGSAATPTHKPSTNRSSASAPTSTKTTVKPSTTASAGAISGKTSPPSGALAPKPPGAGTGTGTIRGQNGLCLDLNGGVAVPFNNIQVATCNGTAAQSWTLATDGTLRVQGMCALIVGDDTVHIIACDTRTTAQWRADGQLLINAANNECLTDPSVGTRSGTTVKVATCNGSAGQRWSLP